MDNISLASSEQMQVISQISIAVSKLDDVTQNNAALVEEFSSASQFQYWQAKALRGIVETFRVWGMRKRRISKIHNRLCRRQGRAADLQQVCLEGGRA